jgi:type IV secretion system protein VirB3
MNTQNETVQAMPIHRSLTRPQLIIGCDRELLIMLFLFAALFIGPGGLMKGGSLINFFFGIFAIMFGVPVLTWLAKKDTSMRQVFTRSVSYKTFYPARSHVTAVCHNKINAKWL